jgi:hypothetical protein
MNVIGIGPLPAGSLVWQRHGNWILTVVCKATFDLLPGESKLAEEQEPLNPSDAHLEDDLGRSMHAPSDLVPFKVRADVILVGYAFAPRGDPVRQLVVRMLVGDVDKALEVVSDRAWTADGALREGPRFTRMPLRYERAGGGPDTANPIGVSPDLSPDSYGMIPLPNLQPVGFVPGRPGDVVLPIGLGPLSGSWPARREKLGRLSSVADRWDAGTLPPELDPAYFNYAPRDQQLERLRDNERLVLENVHPQHPRLVTNLPGVRPRAFADRGEGPQEIPMVADTLWIDTGRAICTLTWRGYVESPPTKGSVVVAMEGPDHPLPWADVQSAARREEAPRSSPTLPFISTRQRRTPDPALPFGRPSSTRAEHTPPSSGAEGRQSTHGLPFSKPPRSDRLVSTHSEANAAGDASPAWLQGRSSPPVAPQGGETVAPTPSPLHSPMPFAPAAPPPAAPPPPVPAPVATPLASPAAPSSPWASGISPGAATAATAAPVAPVVAPALRSTPGGHLPGSAIAASDAAADAAARPASTPRPAAPAPFAAKAPRAVGDVLDLLWYDETQLPRIRAWWEELVTDLDFEPSDPRKDLGAEDPEKARGRHNVFGIMSDGAVIDPPGVARVINEAVNERGRFTPPLALVGGELRFPFDEVETLKATIVAMTPLVGNDKRLKETIDSMSELLKTPYLQGSTGVAPKLTKELRDQFREVSRSLPAGYVDSHVERLLLEQRRYSIRKVFGGEFIRALLGAPGATPSNTSGADAPIPLYLPKHLDQTLPMLVVMKARLIVEAHFQQDPYDTSPHALRAVALGRSFQLTA